MNNPLKRACTGFLLIVHILMISCVLRCVHLFWVLMWLVCIEYFTAAVIPDFGALVLVHPEPKNWVKYAKFEERNGFINSCRQVFERAVEFFGTDNPQSRLLIEFARFEERQKEVSYLIRPRLTLGWRIHVFCTPLILFLLFWHLHWFCIYVEISFFTTSNLADFSVVVYALLNLSGDLLRGSSKMTMSNSIISLNQIICSPMICLW